MNKANECTCPSGDGSLVHPCPAHPAVEQACWDERKLSDLGNELHNLSCSIVHENEKLAEQIGGIARELWNWPQARAALAQPSPKCATCNDSGQIVVSGPHYQGEFQPPEYETEPCDMCAQPSPAQAEQAEAERPEVVARVVHSNPVVLGQCGPLNANDELMTVAQHAASVARWAEMFNRVEQERDAALAEVERIKTISDNYYVLCVERQQQLDAALARVAELERQQPVAWMHDQPNRVDVIHRDVKDLLQRVPGSSRGIHRPLDVSEHYTIPLYAAPVAQAQHSVPELLVRAEDFVSGKEVPQAWLDVQAERRRQVEAEGWTPEHDDLYCAAELPRAAAAYILNGANYEAPAIWPFSAKWWKPSTARRDMVKACALALAEIERLDRAAHGKEGNDD
ncbi:hypothetical protein ACET4X_26760 [Pseudomonas aeruginosa]|uniref:hypothetical protein n=1 Tax=Pseudomonas aeruginosa TaxID=287 RepID=UPI0036E95106